ncbi:MAG: polyhydroxybutyrate depolymerase [Myxococcota bacterium]|jgi:polyhydroxybutyrate depolymerase
MLWLLASCGWFSDGPPALPSLADPCAEVSPGWYTVQASGREALLYLPAGPGPRDAVVALHGNNSSAAEFATITRYAELADRDGFVVVLPQGVGAARSSWHAGPECCGEALARDVDDVAYLDASLLAARTQACATGRVLGVGFSNGGMMLHRWVCEGAEPPDAIAAAAAPAMNDWSVCREHPVPVRLYHGMDDTRVPLAGGTGDRGAHTFRSIEATMDEWQRANQCVPPVKKTVDGDTTCYTWTCAAPTEQCVIAGHGHAWPGGRNFKGSTARMTEGAWLWFTAEAP